MQGSYNIVSELHLQCGQLFKPAFVYLCKVCSGLCLVWMAHRRKSFNCLYKKDILKYTVLISHALYYVFHTLHNIGSIFMFFFQSRALKVVCHWIHIHIFYVFHVEASSLSQIMHHSWKDLRPPDSQNWFLEATFRLYQPTFVFHWMKVWMDKSLTEERGIMSV